MKKCFYIEILNITHSMTGDKDTAATFAYRVYDIEISKTTTSPLLVLKTVNFYMLLWPILACYALTTFHVLI